MSLTEVLEGDFVVSRMLVLDVFEPVLIEEDGSVASAGNDEDFESLNDVSEIFTGSNPISDDDIH